MFRSDNRCGLRNLRFVVEFIETVLNILLP